MTARLGDLKTAIASEAEIEKQAAEHTARAADLHYSSECDDADAARIESEGAAADAMLAGKTAPARRDARAADLRQSAKTKLAAAEKARARAAEVAEGLPAARDAVTSATLGYMREARDDARADLLTALSGAVEPLARMIASDLVRQRLIGDRYQFDPRQHDPAGLWSGAVLVEKLVRAIPPRLRPDGFADAVKDRAGEIAADIIRNLREAQE